MPTPFQHLVYARRILTQPHLPLPLQQCLANAPEAYLLGNTAADVQSITGQPRTETHFYRFPPPRTPRALEVMLAQYPALADPYRLAPAHAAFMSGYLAHLVWDEVWAWEVYVPFYLESTLWAERLPRSLHHNALRVLLDRQAEAELQPWPELRHAFPAAQPQSWLPFATDSALCEWRDWVAGQLENPATVQTTQVFAERMGVTVEALESVIAAIVTDEYRPTVPGLLAAVQQFEAHALIDSVQVLRWYWRAPER